MPLVTFLVARGQYLHKTTLESAFKIDMGLLHGVCSWRVFKSSLYFQDCCTNLQNGRSSTLFKSNICIKPCQMHACSVFQYGRERASLLQASAVQLFSQSCWVRKASSQNYFAESKQIAISKMFLLQDPRTALGQEQGLLCYLEQGCTHMCMQLYVRSKDTKN